MNDATIETLTELIQAEAGCLDAFALKQREFAVAVGKRDWTALQSSIDALQAQAGTLSRIETCRHEIWEDIRSDSGLPSDSSTTRLLLSVSEPGRSALSDAIRLLKVAAIRARIEGDAVGNFVSSAAGTLRGVMEELYPENKDRIYGRTGRTLTAGSRPVVLDTAF